MPDSLVTFRAQQTRVLIDAAGAVRAATHVRRPAMSYLGVGLPDDGRSGLSPTAVAIDADEVEASATDPDGLEVTLRHSFVAGWQVRCVLANSGDARRSVDLRLPITIAEAAVGWAVAEGAEAELFVQPRDGHGPTLAGRLRKGSVERITVDGLHLPTVVLDPGSRYVLSWDWDWLTRPSAYARKRPSVHPVATVLPVGGVVTIPAGPDVAVVAPTEVMVEGSADACELSSDVARSAAVEVRSARGLRTIRLQWTLTPEELLADAAARLLEVPRGPVGVAVLPGIEAAVVLQHGLGADLVEATDDASDALDLFTARLDTQHPDRVLSALYLCGEHERSGELGLLESAADQVLRADRPMPGLGAAATRVCVARVVAGLSPLPVTDHLVGLATQASDSSSGVGPNPQGRRALAAVLELRMLTGTSRADRGAPAASDDLLEPLLALGTELGSGLPGEAVRPLPVDDLAHLLLTLAMVPDRLAQATGRVWGVPAVELVDRMTPTLVARLADAPVGRAHAWLTVLAADRL